MLCVRARFSRLFRPISRTLQDPKIDLLQCIQVSDVQDILLKCRDNSDEDFRHVFAKVQQFSVEPICIPRIACRQTMRENYDTGDSETYYRQSVYIPYLDGFQL